VQSMRRAQIWLWAILAVLFCSDLALAWGPGTHVKFAYDILSNLWALPPAVAALISANKRFFVYGNVATDTVLAKKMSKVKQVCHQWSTGFSLLDSAHTDKGRAFAYGYLAHLAADTIAHNKFLPRQMAVSRSTISFGHFYWELRADAEISTDHWESLRRALHLRYEEPEQLLEAHLKNTLLSFKTNRFLFRQINLIAAEESWRRSVGFWSKLSRHGLDTGILNHYHDESLDRIVDLLNHKDRSRVLHDDPNGNWSLAYAKAQRRQLRQLKRAQFPHAHIIEEAAASHAPLGGNGLKEKQKSQPVDG
jgi:hypothetical protein